MGASKNGVCLVLSSYLFLSFRLSYYFQAPTMQAIICEKKAPEMCVIFKAKNKILLL